jgi:SAM-dependent methyltransferase
MTIISSLVFFILIAFLLTMLLASAAPWVPTRRKDMERILKLADLKPGEIFYDLGCGDGRLITEAARNGASAEGFDISLMSYFMARTRIALERSKARVHFKNFFRQNLSGADIVYLFLTPSAMPKLKKKLEAELKKSSRIISYAFTVPGLEPSAVDKQPGRQTIYLYRVL